MQKSMDRRMLLIPSVLLSIVVLARAVQYDAVVPFSQRTSLANVTLASSVLSSLQQSAATIVVPPINVTDALHRDKEENEQTGTLPPYRSVQPSNFFMLQTACTLFSGCW